MFFAGSASLSALVTWCRAFRHGIAAGLSLPKVFGQQAKKGPNAMRDVADRVVSRLEAGTSLEDSLEPERHRFPPMFLDMVSIGERAGRLPETFGALEQYYQTQLTMRRKFYQEITWPVFQFVAAVGVIAMLIWILGIVAQSNGGEPIAPIGFGLTGASGAVTFLLVIAGGLGLMYGGYRFFTRGVRGRSAVEGVLLKIPAVGPCLDALAMQRFCLGLEMTLEAGLSVDQAARRSLRATSNAAFQACEKKVVAGLKAGRELSTVLRKCGPFSDDFLQILEVAEQTGGVPESMKRQAEVYREDAERRLSGLTKTASFGVWLFVAVLIIFAIFSVFSTYIGQLEKFAG